MAVGINDFELSGHGDSLPDLNNICHSSTPYQSRLSRVLPSRSFLVLTLMVPIVPNVFRVT
jgi:aminoglycoside phosphotransferase (APT) family kinase protein